MNEVAATALEEGHEVDFHMGDGFVFAALPGENPEKFEAALLKTGIDHGLDGLALVLAEGQLEDELGEKGGGGEEMVDLIVDWLFVVCGHLKNVGMVP